MIYVSFVEKLFVLLGLLVGLPLPHSLAKPLKSIYQRICLLLAKRRSQRILQRRQRRHQLLVLLPPLGSDQHPPGPPVGLVGSAGYETLSFQQHEHCSHGIRIGGRTPRYYWGQ